MNNHDGNHPLSRRRFLKLGGASIIGLSALGVSALGRLLVRGETNPVIKDQGVWFVVIDPPYYGAS